jgi:uncharacterized protein YukE
MRYGKYTGPGIWSNPTVATQNLMVSPDELRTVASSLGRMADELHTQLKHWAATVAPASAPWVAGNWHEAQLLSRAIRQTHFGVSQYVTELAQAHHEVRMRLTESADAYDEAEQATLETVKAAASGGSGVRIRAEAVPAHLGRGLHLPQQESAAARHLISMDTAGKKVWNGTVNVTDDAPFHHASVSRLSWQEVQRLILSTDPDAITKAGDAYRPLYEHLTSVAKQLAGHGETLARNWGGTSAVGAVRQLQMLYQTSTDLQANTWTAGQALSWFGPVLKQFHSDLPHPMQAATPAQAATNSAAATSGAQQRMIALNQQIATAYRAMPPAVNKNLPKTNAIAGSGRSGTKLASVTQPPVTSPAAAPAAPPGLGPATGPGGSTLIPGQASPGSPGFFGTGNPGGGGADGGAGGGADGVPGADAGVADGGVASVGVGAGSDAGAAGGMDGMAGFPMVGGPVGGTGPGTERPRQSWEFEDDQTWQTQAENASWVTSEPAVPDGVITAPAVDMWAPGVSRSWPGDGDHTAADASDPAFSDEDGAGGGAFGFPWGAGAARDDEDDRVPEVAATAQPDIWGTARNDYWSVIG